jgi:transketolase
MSQETTSRGTPGQETPRKKKLTTSAMIASFVDEGQKTTKAPFGHALSRLADERPEVVGLSADLAKYTDMHVFRDAHPDRFFQMGMAEQVMLGAAAGMAEVGLVPFASTYAVFAARRAYDFLCLDVAEPNLNVNVVGGLPGLTTGYGPSHQATEDLAIMRGMPNLTIVDPCDSVDIEQAVPALAAAPGPSYMRLLRGAVPTVLDEYDYRFELGKAAELRTGRDVVMISTGLMTMRALDAAERLEADNVDVSVLHVPTIKPLDREAILRAASTDRLLVTLENHTVVGGLAESVASCLAFASQGRRVVPIALPDGFLDTGALPTLHDRYGLSTDGVVAKVMEEFGDRPKQSAEPRDPGEEEPPWPREPEPPSA